MLLDVFTKNSENSQTNLQIGNVNWKNCEKTNFRDSWFWKFVLLHSKVRWKISLGYRNSRFKKISDYNPIHLMKTYHYFVFESMPEMHTNGSKITVVPPKIKFLEENLFIHVPKYQIIVFLFDITHDLIFSKKRVNLIHK